MTDQNALDALLANGERIDRLAILFAKYLKPEMEAVIEAVVKQAVTKHANDCAAANRTRMPRDFREAALVAVSKSPFAAAVVSVCLTVWAVTPMILDYVKTLPGAQ